MNFPDVIVLNGTSSSGKTSLAIALQEALEAYYLHTSLDTFIGMLPKKAFSAEDNDPIVHHCVSGFYGCVPALVSCGNRVIVDTSLDSKEWADKCTSLFQACHTLYVGVHCPLEELERRERTRSDRGMGTAKQQLSQVHLHVRYDIEVNTLDNSPEQCAEQIKQYLVNSP